MKTTIKIFFSIIISIISIIWFIYADTSTVTNAWINNNISLSTSLDNKITNSLNKLNNKIYNSFKVKVLKNNNMFLENWIWYTYTYSKYKNFWKWVIPSNIDLKNAWFNTTTTLLLLDDNKKVLFVTNYKKVKLISDHIIIWISNKQEFLRELADDKKSSEDDTDKLFLNLKNETINLTKWLSETNKILKIYDYILKNISFTETFSKENKEIFSWINTYKNKNWLCWWYSKLYLYMLSFAWISNVEVKKWYVLDSPDFPNVGHAWVKIWDKYYDPTYDDPVWKSKTKTYNQYKYFKLPKDLFYTNKYDFGKLPWYLKAKNLENRRNIVQNNFLNILDKYEDKNYLLLKPFTFRKANSLAYNEKITIETIKNIIPNFEVIDFKYKENNQVKLITNLNYYTVNNSNIETLLKQINYNLDWYRLFIWNNWTYKLSYYIITNNDLAYNK